jgi:hypothetical protein
MSRTLQHRKAASSAANRTRGVALVLCLLLATIVATLAVTTQTAAVVEARIARNAALRDRAFEAAEYAIGHALQNAALDTSWTQASPLRFPATSGADEPMPDGQASFSYLVYLHGVHPLPEVSGAPSAFHFIVEATGRAPDGATDVHVQGFHVVRDSAWLRDDTAPSSPPVRSFWRQSHAE